MKIIVCPNSFKESLSAGEAALCIEKGIRKVFPRADIIRNPLADGGTGTVKSIISTRQPSKESRRFSHAGRVTGKLKCTGKIIREKVTGPLGEKITAEYGIGQDKEYGKFAVIEMASAAGLVLVPENKRNPFFTTTFGVGELVKKALDKNARKIFIGMGDSATNDGGAGLAQALGVRFLDKNKKVVKGTRQTGIGGKDLLKIRYIDISGIDPRIEKTEFIALSDVKNPLTGKNGASYVFSPQKGATQSMVKVLDRALSNYMSVIKKELNKKINIQGAGAAGGLGAGLIAFLNAKIISGVDTIIKLTNLEEKIKNSDFVITGEGKLDEQTASGKVPVGIAKLAKKYGVPVIAIAGWVDKNAEILHKFNISAIMSIVTNPMTIEESKKRSCELIERISGEIMRLIKIGSRLKEG